MTSLLSIEELSALCRPAAQRVAIRLVAETGSTNTDLLADLECLSGPTLLIAEAQTAGKGRGGRAWHAERGATLTFSLAWKFDLPTQALLGLPLAIGVVIAEVLAQFGAVVHLKWPNDVLRDGNKVAGILIETAVAKDTAATQTWAVIGVGINMLVPDSLAACIDGPVAAAPSLRLNPAGVMACLLSSLAEALKLFEEQGFKAFRARWNALHAYGGRQVSIIDCGRTLHEGTAVGIDDSGRLVLDTSLGRIKVVAGDMSLRARDA